MKKILIVYYSQTGNTKKLASSIIKGIKKENNIEIKLRNALRATVDDLLWCDAILVGTPENFGFMSGGLKLFFDKTYYPAKEKFDFNIPYAIFISCENNGQGAVFQIEQIVNGYPFKKTINPLIVKGKILDSHVKKAIEFGQTFAAGLNFGIF